MRQRAGTNGIRVFARSPGSNVEIAATASYCRLMIRSSIAILKVGILSAFTRCWRTIPAVFLWQTLMMMAGEKMLSCREFNISVALEISRSGNGAHVWFFFARRKVSTLILVHRTELLRQWQERLTSFLDLSGITLGMIGGGKKKPTGAIDIAVMQSLARRDDLAELLDRYGQIIVDECHHLSAVSFEVLLKQAKVKYVLGLTATPIRRDGHQPIIFMQCGPVRYRALQAENAPVRLEVWPLNMLAPPIPPESAIQEIFRILAHDAARNQRIAEDILAVYREGRKILVLTERTEQLQLLRDNL